MLVFARCIELEQQFLGKAWRTITLAITYLFAGGIFYHLVEEKDCEGDNIVALDCKESWALIDGLYFSVASISTVGYGDFVPQRDGSKLFTMFYIFFGITLVFSQVAQRLSGCLAALEDSFLSFLDKFDTTIGVSGRSAGISGKMLDLNGDGNFDFVEPPPSIIFWSQRLGPWMVVTLSFQLLSALAFKAVQPGLNFFDAFWHTYITATTVGYGDVALMTQGSRLLAIFHMILSVTFFAALISRVQELMSLRADELKRSNLLQSQLSVDIMSQWDKQGSDQPGVDKVEFLVGMLQILGVQLCGKDLQWDDVVPFLKKFDSADKDGNGRLQKEDWLQMLKSKSNLHGRGSRNDIENLRSNLNDSKVHDISTFAASQAATVITEVQ